MNEIPKSHATAIVMKNQNNLAEDARSQSNLSEAKGRAIISLQLAEVLSVQSPLQTRRKLTVIDEIIFLRQKLSRIEGNLVAQTGKAVRIITDVTKTEAIAKIKKEKDGTYTKHPRLNPFSAFRNLEEMTIFIGGVHKYPGFRRRFAQKVPQEEAEFDRDHIMGLERASLFYRGERKKILIETAEAKQNEKIEELDPKDPVRNLMEIERIFLQQKRGVEINSKQLWIHWNKLKEDHLNYSTEETKKKINYERIVTIAARITARKGEIDDKTLISDAEQVAQVAVAASGTDLSRIGENERRKYLNEAKLNQYYERIMPLDILPGPKSKLPKFIPRSRRKIIYNVLTV
jgi:hypothetical protein